VNTQLEPTIDDGELAQLNRIRVETALSRFPIHRLAKKGDITIDLLKRDDKGRTDFKWEVTYNVKHGQPGPLAYKLDTLVINRKIDEAPRPVPKIIKLGTLYEIAQHLDLGGDTNIVKKALHQNTSAYVEFSIRYRRRDGTDKKLEQGDNRYGVIFTGEKLPGGAVADAVYLVLHDWYRDLLDDAAFRPLDYDYLKQLAPGPQRFYELLSFQIYGAIANGRPRAKLLYSEYCTYAPQTRYGDWEHVRKQMYKIHAPHLKSGYIAKVAYQQKLNGVGNPDWEMLYTPGPKALIEYEIFTTRKKLVNVALPPVPLQQIPPPPLKQQELRLSRQAAIDAELLAEMTRRGIAEKKASALLANLKPGQEVMDQIEYADHLIAQAPRSKFHNPSGFMIKFIEDNCPVPDNFISTRKRRLFEEAQQIKNAERARLAQLQIAYEKYVHGEVERYISEVLAPEEYKQIFNDCHQINCRIWKNMPAQQIDDLTRGSVHHDLKQSGRVPVLSFEAFCQKRVPPRF
jgi:hypothetical protein